MKLLVGPHVAKIQRKPRFSLLQDKRKSQLNVIRPCHLQLVKRKLPNAVKINGGWHSDVYRGVVLQHQVIGVFSPDISRIVPSRDLTVRAAFSASIRAPRQLFPVTHAAGDQPEFLYQFH